MEKQSQDILKPFGEQLKQLVTEHILQVVDSSRQMLLLTSLRNELYWAGKQYLTFKSLDNGVSGVTLQPISVPGGRQSEGQINPQKTLSYTFNITRGDGQKFIAVVGQRQPYVNVVAKDPHNPDSIEAAADGDAVTRYLEDLWDTRSLQKDVARTIWRTGPQFARVVLHRDSKYGEIEVEDADVIKKRDPMEIHCAECGASTPTESNTPVPCPECGSPATTISGGAEYEAPVVTNRSKEPQAIPILEFSTIFETTIPPQAKSLDTDCGWLTNEKLLPSGRIREALGDLVAHIKDDHNSGPVVPSQETMGDRFDVIASADVDQQNRKDLWWLTTIWLKPEMYHYADSAELKKILQENFAEGVRITFVNMKYVESTEENLVDVWRVCKTGTDDRIVSDPICNDLVPINQIINNFFNLAIETVLRGIPKTIVNSRLIDRRAISANEANVAEVLFTNAGVNEDLSRMMAKLPTASFSEQMIELANLFRQYSRELDGALEAIFGGGEPAPTFRQDQQRKNQALAQFYIAYDEMRAFWSGIHKCAHKMLAKYGVGSIEIAGDGPFQFEPRKIDFTRLNPEMIRVEADEKMPMTRAEEADELRAQFADPPQVQEMNGLFHPLNVPAIVGMTQLRGIHSPLSDLTEKSLRLIRQLLNETPAPQFDPMGQPAVDQMTGEPIEQPSLTPDPFEFKNATFAVEIFRSFVNSKSGEDYASRKPEGFRNVRLFGNALEALATAQAAPLAPDQPPVPQDQQPVAA